MPETEARPWVKNRHGGAPRGERPASWDARRLARRLACRVMCTPHGCSAEHPNVSRRSAHPSIGVSEAKLQTPDAKCAAGTRWAVCHREIGLRRLVQRPVVPAKAGTHDHCQWLWVPALPSLSRGSAGTTTGSVLRTNLRLWETIAGSVPLFPACYLQWIAQLQRVEPSARAASRRSSERRGRANRSCANFAMAGLSPRGDNACAALRHATCHATRDEPCGSKVEG